MSNVTSSLITEISDDSLILASVGPGLYATLIGAVLALAGGLQIPQEMPWENKSSRK